MKGAPTIEDALRACMAVLREAEWHNHDGNPEHDRCVSCWHLRAPKAGPPGHAPDCRLRAALKLGMEAAR